MKIKLTAYSLAHFAVLHVIDQNLFNLQKIYKNVTPNRHIPFYAGNVGAPYFGANLSGSAHDYIDLWQFSVRDSVSKWLSVVQILYLKGNIRVHLLSSWDIFEIFYKQFVPIEINRNDLLLPYAHVVQTPAGPRSIMTMLTLPDYIDLTGNSPGQFMIDLMQIVLFGFIVDRKTVAALWMEQSILSYVKKCLLQGSADAALLSMLGRGGETSAFTPAPKVNDEKHYLKIGKGLNHYITKGMQNREANVGFDPMPHHLFSKISEMESVGPFRDDLVAIAKLGGLSEEPAYSDYLTSERFGRGVTPYSPAAFQKYIQS